MQRQSASERLQYGDSIRVRILGQTARDIAQADGVSTEFVAKAIWLSGIYTTADRQAVGLECLEKLTPSHLEVVAKLARGDRHQLLLRAAEEGLPVRELRRLARDRDPHQPRTLGGAADLASACRALEVYATWSDPDLERLMAGPNGPIITGLARAGHALSSRLDDGPPWRCA